MRTRRLGSRGPKISVIGYGAWEAGGDAWGPNESEAVVVEAIQAGLDAGIDWIDTAEVYGEGVSERLVGKAIQGRRDDVVVATKVAPQPDGSGFHRDEVRKACEGSLERLSTDRIDIYQLHWSDPEGTPLEETWGAMAELQDEGQVGSVGVSNFDHEQIERCLATRHVDSLQQEFSMLNREDAELIRWCGEQGVGVVTYGPLAFGLLTGAITADTRFPSGDWRGQKQSEGPFADLARSLEVVDHLRPVAERLGCSLSQLALAWNVHQPGVTAAIAGSRNPAHVRTNAAAGNIELDETTLAELDAILA
jgi:aryl-alcohol dehydrogenase-like predicted oxidoreductase